MFKSYWLAFLILSAPVMSHATAPVGPFASIVNRAAQQTSAVAGTSVSSIHATFAHTLEVRMSIPGTPDRIISQLSDAQVYMMRAHYLASGGTSTLDTIVQSGASAVNSARWLSLNATSPKVAASLALQTSIINPTPQPIYTVYEIYLEYLTSDLGYTAFTAAVAASYYASAYLTASFAAGYTLGTAVNWLLATFDPSFYTAMSQNIKSIADVLICAVIVTCADGYANWNLAGWISDVLDTGLPGGASDDDGDWYFPAVPDPILIEGAPVS